MSQPYDATVKDLFETEPAGMAALLGVVRPREKVKLIDSDLATVSAAADKILRIEDDDPWLLHVEFQSSRDLSLPRRMLQYNALLHARHLLPVASVLVLLREDAGSPSYTGRYSTRAPFGPSWEFAYSVVRVWEWPAEEILTGPVDLLPLAPMGKFDEPKLEDLVRRVYRRSTTEAGPSDAGRIWNALGVLLYMRFGLMTTQEMLQKFPEMREIGFVKLYLDEGRAEGRAEGRVEASQRALLRIGRKLLGEPSAVVEEAIRRLKNVEQLEQMEDRLPEVRTWEELLQPL